MANIVNYQIKVEDFGKNCFEKFKQELNDIIANSYLEQREFNRFEVSTTYMDKESLIELSEKYEMKLIVISYDTGMGYISKVTINNGDVSNYITAFFNIDIEVELIEKCNTNNQYYRELKKYIEANGTNKSINAINL